MPAPRPSDVPTPGWYRTRLVKNGPWIAARIVEADGLWLVFVNGVPTSTVAEPDPWRVPRMDSVAWSAAITEAEYHALLEAAQTAPEGHPLADPTQPVDFRRAPSLF